VFTELGILKLIKRSPQAAFAPAVAMIGVKAGDRVLVIGAGRPALAGQIARVTGLNGQTTVVARGADAGRAIGEAAGQAGALIEVVDAPATQLPLDPQTWDAAVLPTGLAALGTDAPLVLAEAIRVVRPGGRITVCESLPRAGLFRLAQTTAVTAPSTVVARLTAAGLRAARHVGDLDGVAYIEAARPR